MALHHSPEVLDKNLQFKDFIIHFYVKQVTSWVNSDRWDIN